MGYVFVEEGEERMFELQRHRVRREEFSNPLYFFSVFSASLRFIRLQSIFPNYFKADLCVK